MRLPEGFEFGAGRPKVRLEVLATGGLCGNGPPGMPPSSAERWRSVEGLMKPPGHAWFASETEAGMFLALASNAVVEGLDGKPQQWAWAFWHPSFEVALRAAALAPIEEVLDYTKFFNAVRGAGPVAEEQMLLSAACSPARARKFGGL